MWETIGGASGIGAVLAVLGKLYFDWRKTRHDEPLVERSSAVTDAATANTVVLASLDALRKENESLRAKVADLQDENATKDKKLAEFQTRLESMQTDMDAMHTELTKLRNIG